MPGLCRMASGLLLLAALTACSPSLNWREVQLGNLRALLPCKPDTASRPVLLGGQTLVMDMAGCEAAGALYAISRVRAADATQAGALLQAWRQDSVAKFKLRALHPVANSGNEQTSLDLVVDGQRADGSPLQARFKWLQAGADVYQIAAWAGHLDSDQTDNLANEARLP